MNSDSHKINTNNNNNDNYDVSINIPEAQIGLLKPETGSNKSILSSTTVGEDLQIEKTNANESYASRNKDKDENEHEEDEDIDDTDGRTKLKSHVIKMEEEVEETVIDEVDIPDQQTRKENNYAAKKTVAQGMMDIALITANANQLRYIVEFSKNSSTYYINVTLIIISLLLQVGIGVALIFKGKMDLKGKSKHIHAQKINNYVVVGVFMVTIINVFIASFTITSGGTVTTR